MDEDKEASNPFSFKKFMTGSDSQKGKKLEVVDDEDIFKVPDRRQEALKKLIISDDGSSLHTVLFLYILNHLLVYLNLPWSMP